MRRIIAIAAALGLLLTAGCDGLFPATANPPHPYPPSSHEDEKREYRTGDLSCILGHEFEGDVNDTMSFHVTGSDSFMVFIYETDLLAECDAACYGEYLSREGLYGMLDPNGESSFEVRKLGEYDTAIVKLAPEKGDERLRKHYAVPTANKVFNVNMAYKEKDDARTDLMAETIIRTLEYKGSYKTPDTVRVIENDYALAEISPKWSKMRFTEDDRDMIIGYTAAEDLAHYCSYLSVIPLQNMTSSPEELARDHYDSLKMLYEDISEPEGVKLGGRDDILYLSYTNTSRDTTDTFECMWFVPTEWNGCAVIMMTVYKYDGWETVTEEMTELAESITIK